eukprot:949327-Alexandrium_andersonii.AAC.1
MRPIGDDMDPFVMRPVGYDRDPFVMRPVGYDSGLSLSGAFLVTYPFAMRPVGDDRDGLQPVVPRHSGALRDFPF